MLHELSEIVSGGLSQRFWFLHPNRGILVFPKTKITATYSEFTAIGAFRRVVDGLNIEIEISV